MEKVAGPAGIATDSTALYWANLKAQDTVVVETTFW